MQFIKSYILLSLVAAQSIFCSEANEIIPFKYFPEDTSVTQYVSQMPWEHYGLYHVAGLGSFYVDNAADCVKTTIKNGNIWEPYIIDTLSKYVKKGDTVIDIGAHIGTITMALSNLVGPTGQVYSFEGERQFFRELVENLKISNRTNVMPHLCWLSDINTVTQNAGYYGEAYSPVHSFEDRPWKLDIRTLDSFNYEGISLIKMDVECMEDEILAGAKNTIMKNRPILIIEIMGGFGHNPSPAVQSRINKTISILNEMDYTVTKLWVDDYLAIPNEKI